MSAELRTRRYRRWRRAYLARHPLCVRCLSHGRTQAATDVDHIVQWTVGSAIGLGLLLLALFANFNARFDDFSARFDDQSAQIADLRTGQAGLAGQIDDLRTEMTGQIADLRAEVRADVRRLDDRLRAVEVAFGKVDQRLLTLERVLIPAPDPGAPDE